MSEHLDAADRALRLWSAEHKIAATAWGITRAAGLDRGPAERVEDAAFASNHDALMTAIAELLAELDYPADF